MSLATFKKPVYGPPPKTLHQLMGIRYLAPDPGDNGGGGGGGYTPPATQEELDRIVQDRAARAERRVRDEYKDYDDLKTRASKWDEHESKSGQSGNGSGDGKSTGNEPEPIKSEDVDKRIQEALEQKDLELGLERVSDALDKALEGRTFSASALFALDRKQFVNGNKPDTAAIEAWVKENSKESEQPARQRRGDPGQGQRGEGATGGSTASGRDRFESERKKPNRKE